MLIFRSHYQEEKAQSEFERALEQLFYMVEDPPAFLCIGTDQHLQDSFGPLMGTLLQEKVPKLKVMGSLDQPIHAKNLISSMNDIKRLQEEYLLIAIDAAVGPPEDIGLIQLKKGPLIPGKAMARRLPAVGHYSLTAVVDTQIHSRINMNKKNPGLGLAAIYQMARLLSDAIAAWCMKIQ